MSNIPQLDQKLPSIVECTNWTLCILRQFNDDGEGVLALHHRIDSCKHVLQQIRREPIYMMDTTLPYMDDWGTPQKKHQAQPMHVSIIPATPMQLTRTRYNVWETALNIHYLLGIAVVENEDKREKILKWRTQDHQHQAHQHHLRDLPQYH